MSANAAGATRVKDNRILQREMTWLQGDLGGDDEALGSTASLGGQAIPPWARIQAHLAEFHVRLAFSGTAGNIGHVFGWSHYYDSVLRSTLTATADPDIPFADLPGVGVSGERDVQGKYLLHLRLRSTVGRDWGFMVRWAQCTEAAQVYVNPPVGILPGDGTKVSIEVEPSKYYGGGRVDNGPTLNLVFWHQQWQKVPAQDVDGADGAAALDTDLTLTGALGDDTFLASG